MSSRLPSARALLVAGLVIWPVLLPGQNFYQIDGEPTGIEEEIRWLLNRGRFDTDAENARRVTSYGDLPISSGPLAPNQQITTAARRHSEDMARTGYFQHETVPGSAYYDPGTQPKPWDRMRAEGYVWIEASENIAAGYADGKQAYIGWWNSEGHRVGMYDGTLREIGNGYFFWEASQYRRYYTMDLGSRTDTQFFTDTMFYDVNGDGEYSAAEARAGIAIRLLVGGVLHGIYDVSSGVGSFAIPIQAIPLGSLVQVQISNTAPTDLSISVPRDGTTLAQVNLAARESKVYGEFTQRGAGRNTGWRDVAPWNTPPAQPVLSISKTVEGIVLEWQAVAEAAYLPEGSTDLAIWSGLVPNFVTGTTGPMRYVEAGSGTKFYRLRAKAL